MSTMIRHPTGKIQFENMNFVAEFSKSNSRIFVNGSDSVHSIANEHCSLGTVHWADRRLNAIQWMKKAVEFNCFKADLGRTSEFKWFHFRTTLLVLDEPHLGGMLNQKTNPKKVVKSSFDEH